MPPQDDIEYFGDEPEHFDEYPDDGLRPISSDDDEDFDPEIEDAANNHGQDDDYLLDEPPYADEPSDDFPDDEIPDPAEAEDGEMP